MAEKIKVGILGLGRAGRGMHMSEMGRYPEKFEIVAGCDIDPDQIETAKKVTPNARYYTDMKQLFADPEVELVTVATRSLDHVNHALMAFEAGKKVLCEKPVTSSVAEFDRQVEFLMVDLIKDVAISVQCGSVQFYTVDLLKCQAFFHLVMEGHMILPVFRYIL